MKYFELLVITLVGSVNFFIVDEFSVKTAKLFVITFLPIRGIYKTVYAWPKAFGM